MCGIWFIVVGFLVLPDPSCSNSDNLALLLDTLKIIQRSVCNDDQVSLACPRGTTISIQVAQYGKATQDQDCPAPNVEPTEELRKCKRPNSMQYSLLQTVVEACQKKPQCKFSTAPGPGVVDPCPTRGKYVEVAYKCRPYEFRSRIGCEGDVIRLGCNPQSRIAIFDAQYGRTAFETITCPQTQGVPDETCDALHSVKTVMNLCLGKRRCMIPASNKTFNSSCKSNTKPYLKVVYACVPFGVLSEKYEAAAEKDEIMNIYDQEESFFDDSEGESETYKEPNVDRALQPPEYEDPKFDESEESVIETKKTKKKNEQTEQPSGYSQLFLYLSVGILAFIILIGVLIVVRCYISRKNAENSKNGDMYTTEAPNVFNDEFSDIDIDGNNDGNISHISGTFNDGLQPDMILYKNVSGNRATIRPMKPLSTIYPCPLEASMYGNNMDYVPSHMRNPVAAPRFTRSRSNEEEVEPSVMTSPRSLGAHSSFYYD